MTVVGWDRPETALYYEEFCRRHSRYAEANRALAEQARIRPGMRCLDFAAGTGRTAEAALEVLGPEGSVHCVEPAEVMRAAGRARLTDPRVVWTEALPEETGTFDRVLCGAALWQVQPLQATIARLARLLGSGGAFAFNLPSLYLGEPDEPGGGADPNLQAIPAILATRATCASPPFVDPPPDALGIEAFLRSASLVPERWQFRVRLTQDAYRDWLKIPVLTDFLLFGLSPAERSSALDEAFALVDPASWRWERWTGWTAWSR